MAALRLIKDLGIFQLCISPPLQNSTTTRWLLTAYYSSNTCLMIQLMAVHVVGRGGHTEYVYAV